MVALLTQTEALIAVTGFGLRKPRELLPKRVPKLNPVAPAPRAYI